MDINAIVKDAVEKELNENLSGIVEAQAKKMVADLVGGAFKSWGFLTKQVEEQLKESLKIDLSSCGVETINGYMSKVVAQELNTFIRNECGKNLQEHIFSGLKISEKSEWKLSELVENLKEEAARYDDDKREVTVVVKESDVTNSTHIYMDADPDVRYYSCAFQLSVDENGVCYTFEVDKNLKTHYGLERLLFAISVNRAKVIIDDFETEIDRDDDY